ncbi:MAG TPA: Ldh family oxidoreductase [Thermodesulfobacteriota bacterium]|nr:Ldh family oxidoreductase [Thermodesulfobacteriota bacterium]
MKTFISAEKLKSFVETALQSAGVPRTSCRTAASALVEANLCGVDSHGIRMLPGIITLIRDGRIKPKGRIRVIKETPVIAHLDADLVLGSVVGVRAMKTAVEKARKSGIGFVVVRNSSHWGRPAYYAGVAAEKGCIGICFANTESNMPIWGARERSIGNNPIAIGAPRAAGEPVVLDMAMSQAAFFKLVMYNREKKKVPFGWGLDEEGRPTDNPAAIIHSRRSLPMGQHKGSGLALMIDIMTGILSGGKFCGELLSEVKGGPHATAYSQTFIAIDISAFMPLRKFKERVGELVAYVKGARLAEGFQEINIPGEKSWREKKKREKEGIPVDEVTLGELKKVSEELGIPFPGGDPA